MKRSGGESKDLRQTVSAKLKGDQKEYGMGWSAFWLVHNQQSTKKTSEGEYKHDAVLLVDMIFSSIVIISLERKAYNQCIMPMYYSEIQRQIIQRRKYKEYRGVTQKNTKMKLKSSHVWRLTKINRIENKKTHTEN